ncbi:nitroreductase/quinone reductase family protein [Rhodococcus ruber]|uniref:Nitroreductase/quinone reductase family protein n=1 Tax=Rhodococcus ruber TaxID=1830 RepID=A0ABT4MEV9_9NOCA|nr:nitroreductase/quinone reductase family protein [Rhodococcus ruber]MCZ4519501.1 nitroreductase/quinone reductase family protein [Rhodococcus ruber]
MNMLQKSALAFNKVFVAVMNAPVLGKVVGRGMGILTYTGRRSGKKISLPVAFKRKGKDLEVRVVVPDQKNWWRNFINEGGRVDVERGGVHQTGIATASRDDHGRVFVDIALDR